MTRPGPKFGPEFTPTTTTPALWLMQKQCVQYMSQEYSSVFKLNPCCCGIYHRFLLPQPPRLLLKVVWSSDQATPSLWKMWTVCLLSEYPMWWQWWQYRFFTGVTTGVTLPAARQLNWGKPSLDMPTTGHGTPSASVATSSEVALKSGLKYWPYPKLVKLCELCQCLFSE